MIANSKKGLAKLGTEQYFSCCGKTICRGCDYSFCNSGNMEKCPFCNADRCSKTDEEMVDELMNRIQANDPASIYFLANSYHNGLNGYQQDLTKAIELYAKSAELGYSMAHYFLGDIYHEGGDLKKAKIHYEAAAMAGHEFARYNLGILEAKSGKMEQAVKHWTIIAMNQLLLSFEKGVVGKETINSTLIAYNNSCTEFRSESRDASIRVVLEMDDSMKYE